MRAPVAILLVLAGCSAPPPDATRELFAAVAELRAEVDAALDAKEPVRIELAASSLGRLAREALPELLAALGGPDAQRQEAAAFALGFSRSRAAAAPLAAATESPNAALRSFAIASLGMLGAGDVPIEPFERLLRDDAWQVRLAALFALRQETGCPPTLLEAVQARLSDPVVDVRNEALLVLGRAGAEGAIDVIAGRSLREPDPRVRANAARALGAIGKPAEKVCPALIEALRDAEPRVVEAAWSSLRAVTGEEWGRYHEPWRRWWERRDAARQ